MNLVRRPPAPPGQIVRSWPRRRYRYRRIVSRYSHEATPPLFRIQSQLATQKLARKWSCKLRGGNWLVDLPNELSVMPESTPFKLVRLNRLKTSPLASIFIFSEKNHGTLKYFSKVKSKSLYPGLSYVLRPRVPTRPRPGAGNCEAVKIPLRNLSLDWPGKCEPKEGTLGNFVL